LELRLEGLDMRWREFTQWQCADAWRNLALDKLAMAHRCLAGNPALNIDHEPMLQIFRHTHLCRVDVGPLIPTIEQAV
jgi:hypothetical protein